MKIRNISPPIRKSEGIPKTGINPISKNWTRENIAWLAGLFEGEGHVPKSGARNLVIQMTDEDVIRKAHFIAGVGYVFGPIHNKTKPPHYKPLYRWRVSQRLHAYALAIAIYPYMGQRRKHAIEELIKAHGSRPQISTRMHGTYAKYKRGCRCARCRDARKTRFLNAHERTQISIPILVWHEWTCPISGGTFRAGIVAGFATNVADLRTGKAPIEGAQG